MDDGNEAPAGLLVAGGRLAVEAAGQVAIAEPDDGVLAGQGGPEQGEVGGADGVEAGMSPASVGDRLGVPVEHGEAGPVVVGGGQASR